MIKNKHPIFLLIFLLLFSGCQDVKKGITGKKINEGEEFLVIKKNPLVVPPDFEKMPLPKNEIKNSKSDIAQNDQNSEFEKFLTTQDKDIDASTSKENTGNLEKRIIDKIK